MKNLNIDFIQNMLQQKGNLKVVKTRIAAVMLAATATLSAGTVPASAANVSFDTITITQDGGIKEQDYTSSYLSDKDARTVRSMMKNIEAEYQNFYNLMANGALATYTVDQNANIARLIATNNDIKNRYEADMREQKFSSTEKEVINKYLQSKEAEAKALFSSLTYITIAQIDGYAKEYDCTFASVNNNMINVAVYKKGSSYTDRVISFDNSILSTDKALISMPSMDVVTYNNKTEAIIKYQGVVINSVDVNMVNQVMKEAEALYDKVETALNKGNYTKKSGSTMDDVYVALNGDLNLISSSLEAKYATYTEVMKTIRMYINYRTTELTVKAYNKNKSHASYFDFVNYANVTKPIRSYEENGYVYYNLGNYNGSLYRIKDNGYVTTKGLSATGAAVDITNPTTPVNPVIPGVLNATVHTGINIYYNDYRFYPVDANGNAVQAFVYNGTTYLPVRAVAGLCNYNVEWDQATSSVRLTRSGSYSVPQTSYNNVVEKSQLVETYMNANTNVRVFIDGVELIPRDANGNLVPVINWNGTTYLPVRALAGQVGLAVNYDSANNVVFLGQHYIYEQPTTPTYPTYPETPSVPSNPGTTNTNISDLSYIVGTKDGVQYKIYFDDNGFYVNSNGQLVPVDVTEYSFEEVKTR